ASTSRKNWTRMPFGLHQPWWLGFCGSSTMAPRETLTISFRAAVSWSTMRPSWFLNAIAENDEDGLGIGNSKYDVSEAQELRFLYCAARHRAFSDSLNPATVKRSCQPWQTLRFANVRCEAGRERMPPVWRRNCGRSWECRSIW